ncbi:MAG: hypothetical protein WD096_11190 [Actinomycetota bacterium]
MPKSKGRKRRTSRERRTQRGRAAEPVRSPKRISFRRYRLQRAAGFSLVGLAVVIGVSHWLTHIGAWGFASQGVMDLVAGYPMAFALGIAGTIVLSRS